MRSVRVLSIILISGALVLGALLDQATSVTGSAATQAPSAVAFSGPAGSTWFCPGGSDAAGPARVGVELINAGPGDAELVLTAMGTLPDTEPVVDTLIVPMGGRTVVALESLMPGDPWAAAVVETTSPSVIVRQLFDGSTGTDRSPCLTRTAEAWVVPDGATRIESEGERMILLLFNPFPDDAVADIDFEADVGLDSLAGVVAPARRVTAIDITDEVTVASHVSAMVDVISGRLAVARVQTHDSDRARGLSVESASPVGASVIYLPTVSLGDGRIDTINISNPSFDEIAQVDVEIVADTDVLLDPIELTIHPRRTIEVAIPDESRLADLGSFSLVVRSLSGIPVSASLNSLVAPGGDLVVGSAASTGADIASDSWMVPIEPAESATSRIVVVNPSALAVSRVTFSVLDTRGATIISTVELGPGRRTSVESTDFGNSQAVARIESSSPVVVGDESEGLTSRSMSAGIRSGEAVEFSDVP